MGGYYEVDGKPLHYTSAEKSASESIIERILKTYNIRHEGSQGKADECSECDGSGYTINKEDSEEECRNCEGDGYIPQEGEEYTVIANNNGCQYYIEFMNGFMRLYSEDPFGFSFTHLSTGYTLEQLLENAFGHRCVPNLE